MQDTNFRASVNARSVILGGPLYWDSKVVVAQMELEEHLLGIIHYPSENLILSFFASSKRVVSDHIHGVLIFDRTYAQHVQAITPHYIHQHNSLEKQRSL